MLPARYTLEGTIEQDDPTEPWPNFQIDGYGMWLWSLERHRRAGARRRAGRTVDLTASISPRLAAPCWSCWEETRRAEHASTLLALATGWPRPRGCSATRRSPTRPIAVRDELAGRRERRRRRKGAGQTGVDSSMLWLGASFGLAATTLPWAATVEAVEQELIVRTAAASAATSATPTTAEGSGCCSPGGSAGTRRRRRRRVGARAARLGARAGARERRPARAGDGLVAGPRAGRALGRALGTGATPLLWSHAMFLISEAAA